MRYCMKNYRLYKTLVITISFIAFIAIFKITTDLILEEHSRIFELDFINKSDVISSYGTLISGLLTFLSILFVIFALISSKNEQIQKEEKEKSETRKNLSETYNVLVYYLKTLIGTIDELNLNVQKYVESEKKNPTINNALLFNINKNFVRIIEMDTKSVFMSFQEFYQEESKEKDFVNLYKMIDFYSDLYFAIREDYEKTKNFKYDNLITLGFEILDLYNKKADLIDGYKKEFPTIYIHKPWVEISSKSIGSYYKYIDDCEKKKIQTDFDYISNSIFKTFIESALRLRESIGYGNYGEQEILRIISTLRKKLFYIKQRVYHNADSINITREEYLDENSPILKEFRSLIQKMETYSKEQPPLSDVPDFGG